MKLSIYYSLSRQVMDHLPKEKPHWTKAQISELFPIVNKTIK